MRIVVANTHIPFATGGAERQCSNLVQALRDYGHDATAVLIPFKFSRTQSLVDHIHAAGLLDLSDAMGQKVDRVIGLRFPAYLIRHPDPVFWIIHQYRQAYDWWDDGTSDLLQDPEGMAVRQMIMAEDRAALGRSQHPIYTDAQNVSDRLNRYLGIPSQPLYHPPALADHLGPGDLGEAFFAPRRICPSKRFDLILKALAKAPAVGRLIIAGTSQNAQYDAYLRSLIRDLDLETRVEWINAPDDATMARLYAQARAVVFAPRDEDYGYITLEAMLAGKAVITLTDSGGPLEFVVPGETGLITPPDANALGAAMTQLAEDANLAERMGQAALAAYKERDIGWHRVVERLTRQAAQAHPILDQAAFQ